MCVSVSLLICSLLYRANISLTTPLLQAQDACVYVDEEVCQTEKQEVCEDGTEWCEQIYFKEREKSGYQCIANGVGPQGKKWLKRDNFSHFGGTKKTPKSDLDWTIFYFGAHPNHHS